MSRKIAILLSREFYTGDYDDYYHKIIDSITDWEEVSDEDYKTLQLASYTTGFQIIERPVNTPAFIAKTVADYLVAAKAAILKAEEEKKKRAAVALERKHKKELKDKESKLKLLKKLQEELGADLA